MKYKLQQFIVPAIVGIVFSGPIGFMAFVLNWTYHIPLWIIGITLIGTPLFITLGGAYLMQDGKSYSLGCRLLSFGLSWEICNIIFITVAGLLPKTHFC